MSESNGVRRRNIMIAVTTAAVVIVAAVAVAVGLSGDSDDGTVAAPSSDSQTDDGDSGATPDGDGEQLSTGVGAKVLPEAMGGQEAIDALGDKLSVVAERNNMTADKLRDLLLTDATLKVTPSGSLLYVDNVTRPPSE